MPKYTYQISFNSSDYVSLTPGKNIQFDGFWEEGTKIWREQINELYIIKNQNSSTYTTLETWFDDATKFETRIWIKVLKSGVQDSLHWFGVKWGTLNKDQTTYVVQPIVYDNWGQYFEATKDEKYIERVNSPEVWFYYGDATTYPFIDDPALVGTIEDILKRYSSEASGWLTTDVVSSFILQDAYEDASAVGTYQGMPLDYVTEVQSYLSKCGITTGKNRSFAEMLEWLTLIKVWVFFDTNDKLRYEHIQFFNDRLADNAVDFSSYINSYDEEWSYLDPAIPVYENISMQEKEADTYEADFTDVAVKYSDVRNRPDAQKSDYISGLYSNISGLADVDLEELVIMGGLANAVYKWFNIDMTVFVSDWNSFDIDWNVGSGADKCGSSDIVDSSGGWSLTVFLTALSGTFDVYFEDRSDSTLLSNKISVSATGTTTGTITPTLVRDDAFLKIEATAGSPGFATGWITITHATSITVPTVEGIVSTDPKTNGGMSISNVFEKWWQDDRLSHDATINGSDYVFTSTQYNLVRKEITIYYAGVINPLYGFNDGTRVAMIDTWTRDPETDFYKINLIYQEDE